VARPPFLERLSVSFLVRADSKEEVADVLEVSRRAPQAMLHKLKPRKILPYIVFAIKT
jgi:hypothetical protein